MRGEEGGEREEGDIEKQADPKIAVSMRLSYSKGCSKLRFPKLGLTI